MKNKKIEQKILVDEKIGKDCKYHYFYKITNLLNDKTYLGVHTTNNLMDGYVGSGKILKKSYEYHGVEYFQKEILLFFETEEEMYEYELAQVTGEIVNDKNYYNVSSGGRGGRKDVLVVKDKNGNISTIDRNNEKYLSGELISINHGNSNPMYGRKHSEETKKIMSEKRKKYLKEHPIKHRNLSEETKNKIGDNNRGRKRLIKDGIVKYVKPYEIEKYIQEGWNFPKKGKVCIKRENEVLKVGITNLDKYIEQNWKICTPEEYKKIKKENAPIPLHLIKGTEENIQFIEKCRNSKVNRVVSDEQREKIRKTMIERGVSKGKNNPMYGIKRKWITNGVINHNIKLEDVETFLNEHKDFYLGRIFRKKIVYLFKEFITA